MEIHWTAPTRWDKYHFVLWKITETQAVIVSEWDDVCTPGRAEDAVSDEHDFEWYCTWMLIEENCAPGNYMLIR